MSEKKLNKNQISNPRYDLYTKEILPYKSKDFYENSLYSNRQNLIRHFKTLDSSEIIRLTTEILLNRKKVKGLSFSPSNVELRSIIAPSLSLLAKAGINYEDICSSVGLVKRYKYAGFQYPKNKVDFVIVDSREQTPLKFPKYITTEVRGLKVGDYAKQVDVSNDIVIERKNLNDFVSTMSSGFERFHKELNRGEQYNAKVLMVVEACFSQAASFNYLPHLKYSKATPEFIFSRAREIIQNYPNFQIVFVDGRIEAADITLLALNYGPNLLDFDVQYLYDSKQIDLTPKL